MRHQTLLYSTDSPLILFSFSHSANICDTSLSEGLLIPKMSRKAVGTEPTLMPVLFSHMSIIHDNGNEWPPFDHPYSLMLGVPNMAHFGCTFEISFGVVPQLCRHLTALFWSCFLWTVISLIVSPVIPKDGFLRGLSHISHIGTVCLYNAV